MAFVCQRSCVRCAPGHPTSSNIFGSLGEGSKGCKSCPSDLGSLTGGGSKTLFIFQLLLTKLSLNGQKPRAKPVLCCSGGAAPPARGQTRLRQCGISATTRSAQLMLSKAEHVPQALPSPELTATDSSSTRQVGAVIFWHFTSQNDKVLSIKCSPVPRARAMPGTTPALPQHTARRPSPRTGHHSPGNRRAPGARARAVPKNSLLHHGSAPSGSPAAHAVPCHSPGLLSVISLPHAHGTAGHRHPSSSLDLGSGPLSQLLCHARTALPTWGKPHGRTPAGPQGRSHAKVPSWGLRQHISPPRIPACCHTNRHPRRHWDREDPRGHIPSSIKVC